VTPAFDGGKAMARLDLATSRSEVSDGDQNVVELHGDERTATVRPAGCG
jgi:hypothetical protein